MTIIIFSLICVSGWHQDEVCVLIMAFNMFLFCLLLPPPYPQLQILFSDFPLMFLLAPKSYESVHLLCTFRIWVLLEKVNLSVSHFIDQDLHALLLNGIKGHRTVYVGWFCFFENKYFILTAYLWKDIEC